MDFIDWKIKDWRLQKRGIKRTLKRRVWIFQLLDWISLCQVLIMWWQNIWARRASELVKCLLFIFSSDVAVAAAVVVLRGCWLLDPAACIVLCFWSAYLCVWACVAISRDLPLCVGWLNLSECYLFFLPFLVDICFFFSLILFRFTSNKLFLLQCLVEERKCWSFQRSFSHALLAGRFAGMQRFSPQVEIWNLCDGNRAGLGKKSRKWRKCTSRGTVFFFVKRLQHLSFINAADYPDL